MKAYLCLLFTPLFLFSVAFADPWVKDGNLVVQKYVHDICCSPTTMAFVGNDILVLEKSSGEVHLIRNNVFEGTPVLKENVTSDDDQGMLGIDAVGNKVYLYFTESSSNGKVICNCVYSYDWNGENLVNRTLVKVMPHFEIYHLGGVMATGLDGSVYLVVGDNGRTEEGKAGVLENNGTGQPDDTGVISRILPPGPYYAIGIRNSFGLTVDPKTGSLWDTENGPDYGDEVNMVPPDFNSGWGVVAGKANASQLAAIPHYKNYVYHDPQFTWQKPVAPTAISFLDSDKFPAYRNSVLVGDCNNGNLYKFELNKERNGFVFQSPQLQNNIAADNSQIDEITFGKGFGCITDVKVGPDGLVYVVSLSDGVIYRLVPKQFVEPQQSIGFYQYVPYVIASVGGILSFLFVKRLKTKRTVPA